MNEPTVGRPPGGSARPRRSVWKTLFGALVVLGVTVGLGLLLSHCARPLQGGAGGPGGQGRGGGPGGRPMVTVGVAAATVGEVPIQLNALGTVIPLTTINVNARVSGMLERVTFREGQMVRKGQLLAEIDPRPFQIALQQTQGQLLHDQALLRTARLDLARYQTLKAEDSIAAQTLDTQAALVSQDEATVSADEAAVANARLNLSFTQIVSPVAGRVGLRQVDAGNQIVANQATPVTVITQVDPISVVFSLPEGQIAQVTRRGGGAGLPVTAYDRAGGVALARGLLATLDNQIDTTTGTVKAKATFANPGLRLFPNQFVNVVLLVDTLHGQVIVPTTATRHGPQGDFVWVLQPDKTVKSRPVAVGPGTPETVSIVSGLRPGEVVITDGGDRLREDAKVVLPGPPEGGPTSGGASGGHRHHGGAAQ